MDYATGEGVRRLATATVAIAPGAIFDVKSYIIKVRMLFGATELQVSARDEQSGKEVETSVRFAFDQSAA